MILYLEEVNGMYTILSVSSLEARITVLIFTTHTHTHEHTYFKCHIYMTSSDSRKSVVTTDHKMVLKIVLNFSFKMFLNFSVFTRFWQTFLSAIENKVTGI